MIGKRRISKDKRKGMERIMKTTLKKTVALLLTALMLFAFSACAQETPASNPTQAPTTAPTAAPAATPEATSEISDDDVDGELILDYEEEFEYAELLTMTHYKGGYTAFTVSGMENEFLLVPEGKSVPADLADNVTVLQQPINKTCFNSASLVSLVDAIDGLDNIATVGVALEKWYLPNVIKKMEADEIKYSGAFSAPDFEMLVAEGVQLELDTSMLNSKVEVIEKYKELGIPYIIDPSSSESHPLARVEWVKLLGAIFDLEENADTFFEEQKAKVNAVSNLESTGKTMASFFISNDQVGIRNGQDYIKKMVDLAGAEYVPANFYPDENSYTKVSFEEFYAACKDADYLLYSVFTFPYGSIEGMIEYNALFADFKAVQEGNVYYTVSYLSQATSSIAGVIEDINTILNDPSIESTETVFKVPATAPAE